MAATLTAEQELTFVSFPIEKAESTPDGDLVVYGKATDGSVDSDEQIVDPDFAGKALAEWLETGGNIRVQHNPQRDPAGKGLGVEVSPDGHYVKSLVVEPTAKRLVEKGVLRAYSVGIARPVIVRDSVARGGRITGGQIVELSLVDRPANKNCGIALVKSAGDGAPEYVGKVFGADDLLVKYAGTGEDGPAEKSVTLELPEDVSVAFSPTDLAKLIAHRQRAQERLAEKEIQASGRVVDSSGKDRSHVADEDFAGPGKTFPIETQGDVSDAASLAHHADNPAQVRANIKRIARRKFPDMDLPPSLDGGSEKMADPDLEKETEGKPCPLCKGSGKIREGNVKCPKCKGDGKLTAGEAQDYANRSVEADVEKGLPCPGCGAKSKSKFCPECGKKMPVGKGEGEPTKIIVEGKGDKDGDGDGLFDADGDGDGAVARLPEEGSKKARLAAIKAALKGEAGMPGSGKPGEDEDEDGLSSGGGTAKGEDDDKGEEAADEAREETKARKAKLKKGKKNRPVPTDGVQETAPAKPVPAHREPDGMAIEAFEDDAGLQEGDEHEEERAAAKFRLLNVPHQMGALHDLTCPAYSTAAVAKAHPYATLERLISVPEWQDKALSLTASAPLDLVPTLLQLGQQAATLKSTPGALIDDIRDEVFKAFQDANPGPGSAPKPGDVSPGRFSRPYLSAGHAAASPGQAGPNKAPMPSGQTSAADYGRGYLSGGHAANSPANTGASRPPAPSRTGAPAPVSFTSLQRDNAAQAMSAMHDHVAQTFPDLCPVYHGGSPYGSGGPQGAPVPASVGGPGMAGKNAVPTEAQLRRKLAKQVLKGRISLDDAREMMGLEPFPQAPVEKAAAPAAAALTPDLIKSAVAEAVAGALAGQAEVHKAELKSLKKQLKTQSEQIDKLASQPDPDGPYRAPGLIKSFSAAPAGPLSVSQRVEHANDALIRSLQEEARNSYVPQQREAALAKLREIYAKNL